MQSFLFAKSSLNSFLSSRFGAVVRQPFLLVRKDFFIRGQVWFSIEPQLHTYIEYKTD